MKVLFSLYRENPETEESRLVHSRLLESALTVEEIDGRLQLYEGFRSDLTVGERLCFWDIYCFFDDVEAVWARIEGIPVSHGASAPRRFPRAFILETFNPGNSDGPFYPDENTCAAYRVQRFERGASGFEQVVLWAAGHPIEMLFIGGAVWDTVKWIGSRLFRGVRALLGLGEAAEPRPRRRRIYFSAEKFYRNFEQMTHIRAQDCQIVFLAPRKGHFALRVRTIRDEQFSVTCRGNGKILSLKKCGGARS